MKEILITVCVKPYFGKNNKQKCLYIEKLKAAKKIEEYLNNEMRNYGENIIEYGEIAKKLYLRADLVEELLFPIGGGQNGITLKNPIFENAK